MYGENNAQFTGSVVSGAVQGESFVVTASSEANAASNVGEYDIIPSVSGATLTNYIVVANKGILTITPRAITLTADAGQSKVYGDNNPAAYTYQVTAGSLVEPSHLTGTLARVAGENVGSYAITQGTLAATNNYALTYVGNDFTIVKRHVTVTADLLSKVYGDNDPELSYKVTAGSVVNQDAFTGALKRATGEDVSTYAVTLGTLSLGSNYNLTLAEGTVFTITPKAITVTPVAGQIKVYGTADPALSYTSTALVGSDTFSGALSREPGNNVGSYNMTRGTLALSSNYTLEFVEGITFRITPKSLVASISAEDKVYDGTSVASVSGAVPAADIAGSDVVEVTVSNASFEDKNVGTGKRVTAVVTISNSNYSLSSETATTTASITAKGLTASISASDKVYDGNRAAAVAASLTQGLVANDEVTVSASEGLFDTKNVGVDKPVTAKIRIEGKDAQNYLVNATAATTASITAKPITVIADAKSKTYGDQDPTLTYSAAPGSLIEGDSFTGALKRVAGENVGAYAIEQNTLSAGNNYAVTYVPANLTISQRAIEVTADAKQKMEGQADPALTHKVTSGALVFTDTFSGTLERAGGEAAGEYAIIQGTLSAGNNYNLTYKGANLTIHAIPTVAIDNPAPVQYSTAVTVSARYTGIVTNPVWVWGFTANTAGVQNAGSITGSTTAPATPGVYTLVLKYRNAVGDELSTAPAFLSVYDPEGGFVTGGGWINSPVGALNGSDVTGKANFGFVAKYKKGKNEVEGNTEFQFQAGNINFNSSAHTTGSLVISGAKATYKGIGTIAGLAGTYEFMVVATDGQVTGGGGNDKFRIKIWNGGTVIYDNARGQLENAELGENTILGGGSIVIHEVKAVTTGPKNNKVVSEELVAEPLSRFDNYPNAFADRTTIRFSFDTEQRFELEVYDIKGALVKKVATGVAEAGQVYEYELDGRNLAEGVYFGRLATGAGVKTIKMLLKK